MSLSLILLIVLVLLLLGALPTWSYSSGWGYGPSSAVSVRRTMASRTSAASRCTMTLKAW